jgi:hypothetical protein
LSCVTWASQVTSDGPKMESISAAMARIKWDHRNEEFDYETWELLNKPEW